MLPFEQVLASRHLKGVPLSDRVCPNCGHSMPGTIASCQCGFVWTEGADMPAPEIVRSAVGQPSAVDQVPLDSNLATQTVRQDGNMDMELPPFPWEKKPSGTASPTPASSEPGMVKTSDQPAGVPEVPQVKPTRPVVATTSPATSVRPNAALLMACPTCEANISRRASSCPKCKSAPYSHCLICATRLLVSSKTCSECGDPDPFTLPAGANA